MMAHPLPPTPCLFHFPEAGDMGYNRAIPQSSFSPYPPQKPTVTSNHAPLAVFPQKNPPVIRASLVIQLIPRCWTESLESKVLLLAGFHLALELPRKLFDRSQESRFLTSSSPQSRQAPAASLLLQDTPLGTDPPSCPFT